MKRWLGSVVVSAAFAFAVVSSCHENRRVDSAATPPSAASGQPAAHADDRTVEERSAAALVSANDVVESARIMSLPLQPLGANVMRGMALPTYTELPDLSYEQMLARVQSTGATHVSIVVSWNQQTIFHNRLRPDPDETPSDKRFAAVITAARAQGLQVLIFPIIHVERRNEGEWRGRLAPTSRDRWNKEYRDFILHYADLAEKTGAEILSVGSELSSLEHDQEFWLGLIADVRSRYSGKLVYSANWDHYKKPGFWSAVDFLGVSSYFEVAKRENEPIHLVTDRWLEHRRELTAYAAKIGRPLILTEVGYPATDFAAVKPWDYTRKTTPNPNAQLAAFRSLTDAWSTADDSSAHFAGLFIWHAWGHGGREDVSYPVWGKTSEKLIREWYNGK